jgi:hypothetical protein
MPHHYFVILGKIDSNLSDFFCINKHHEDEGSGAIGGGVLFWAWNRHCVFGSLGSHLYRFSSCGLGSRSYYQCADF